MSIQKNAFNALFYVDNVHLWFILVLTKGKHMESIDITIDDMLEDFLTKLTESEL